MAKTLVEKGAPIAKAPVAKAPVTQTKIPVVAQNKKVADQLIRIFQMERPPAQFIAVVENSIKPVDVKFHLYKALVHTTVYIDGGKDHFSNIRFSSMLFSSWRESLVGRGTLSRKRVKSFESSNLMARFPLFVLPRGKSM